MEIAAIQTPGTTLSDWAQTLELGAELLAEAAGRGAKLALLPECFWPAYRLPEPASYFAARAAGLPAPQTFIQRLQKLAADYHLGICAGFVDENETRLGNAAALIGPTGDLLGVHYKCFLWDFDRDCFERGNAIRPLNTPWGAIGLLICADARLPEIPATLAARGARLLLQPTGWVDVGGAAPLWNPQPDFLIPQRAAELGVPMVSASKWGREGDTTFVGRSLICDHEGHILEQCGPTETSIIVADVELRDPQPCQLTERERDVLMGNRPPISPVAAVPPIDLFLAPPQLSPEHALQSAEDHTPPEHHSLVLALPREDVADAICGEHGLWLCRPGTGPHLLGLIQLVSVDAGELQRFAPLRCHALGGLHLAVAHGSDTNLRSARCRACENRVIVIWAAPDRVTIIDTAGNVICDALWPPAGALLRRLESLDVSAAALKEVARGTHVLADRVPDQYAF